MSLPNLDLGADDRTIQVANGSQAIDLIINGSTSSGGGLIKTNTGMLQLAGTHTLGSGSIDVQAGGLSLDSATISTNSVTIGSGTNLEGEGTFNLSGGNFLSNGLVGPGLNVGTINVNGGDTTFSATSTYEAEVSFSTNDLFRVSGGSLTIDPAANT